jgi:hypothetical protein
VKDADRSAEQLGQAALLDGLIGPKRLDFDGNPEAFRKIPLCNERGGEGVKDRPALFFLDDARGVQHMVEMTMSDHEQIDFVLGEVFCRAVRSIEKNISAGCGIEKTIGFEHSARKAFEPIHRNVVQY